MYTILINEQNELVTTQRQRIMQRSKLVDTLHFLVKPTYGEIDLTSMTVLLEYVLPVSREYRSEILTLSDELYKDHLEYKLPFDTTLTKEAGDIEIQISFMSVYMTENGEVKECVRKTSPTLIPITPIAKWADYIPSSALSPLDQRILKTDAQIQALSDLSAELYETQLALSENQVDDLQLNEDKLHVSVKGKPVGEGVKIVIPSKDDGEIDGVGDGILDLDIIKQQKPDNSEDNFLEL